MTSFNQQDWSGARRSCRKTLNHQPKHGGAHHLLGLMLYNSGDYQPALTHFENAVRFEPQSAMFLAWKAKVQAALGQNRHALESYSKARVIAPDSVMVLSEFGDFLRQQGKPKEAMQLLSRALKIDPSNVVVLRCAGNAFHEMGLSQQALSCFQMALVAEPDNAMTVASMGSVYFSLGKAEEAENYFRAALKIKPDLVFAHLSLASVTKDAPTEHQLATLKQLKHLDMSLNDQISLRFALAQIYTGLKCHDEAFAEYVSANKLREKGTGGRYDITCFERETAARTDVFDRDFFGQRAGYGIQTKKPVFIVGMPRSGTTLIESIIGSHSQCQGGGELSLLAEVRSEFEDNSAGKIDAAELPQIWRSITPEAMTAKANLYLEFIDKLAPTAARVVDKMPHNFLNLWLVAMMLPQAKIIHCKRNPLDTCVSIFFEAFRGKHAYKNDLRTLGLYYHQYQKLMSHWSQVLPVSILEVQYEDLITDQEGVSRQIIDFCELAWEPDCLDFHSQDQAVLTASAMQVKKKIYNTSVERWRRYEKHLGPLIDGLG